MACGKYDKSQPINIGTGQEIAIRDLILLINELMKFNREILWDTTKPDGQPRRRLAVSKAFREFGFRAKVGLKEGLAQTIKSYRPEKYS